MPRKKKIIINDASDEILTEENIEDCIQKTKDDAVEEYNCVTDVGKSLSVKYIADSTTFIEREKTINTLDKYLNNMKISRDIESGIFEYAITYVHVNNLDQHLVYAVYSDKLMDIINNIDNNNPIKNNYLKKNILTNKLNPIQIAFMKPHELFPDNWEFFIRKNNLRKYKEENLAATDNYKCRKCKERRCKVTQLQLRSADEPMTNIVECLVCGFTFKC